MARRFGWDSLGWRFALALAVVFASYNPSGWSFWHWAAAEPLSPTPLKGIAGVVLLIGWVVLLRATLRSLGGFGILLAAALFGCVVWGLLHWGVVPRGSTEVIRWLAQLVVVAVLTAGVSWSHVRRRISGQYDMDDVDEA
ncbi:MAG: DUF6524 family protein [Halofilum sp. (in: g-proteobacteria)]|nr:DUF6524 family protein [Halofilum sp. (in: g-proteobacteria)]